MLRSLFVLLGKRPCAVRASQDFSRRNKTGTNKASAPPSAGRGRYSNVCAASLYSCCAVLSLAGATASGGLSFSTETSCVFCTKRLSRDKHRWLDPITLFLSFYFLRVLLSLLLFCFLLPTMAMSALSCSKSRGYEGERGRW